jgi:type IV pilus assembly protein PilY1
MNRKLQPKKRPIIDRLVFVSALLAAFPIQAQIVTPTGTTSIANAPFTVDGGSPAKPNIMFILDDSGSMNSAFMPDVVDDKWRGTYGYASAQCNGVYFDPSLDYDPPKKSDGSSYPNISFTSAPSNGFDTGSSTINLEKQFRAHSDESQGAAYYYKYTGAVTVKDYVNTNSAFYKECNKKLGSDAALFVKVVVSTVAEKQKFANWYSYYRTRMLTMKSGVGAAFAKLDENMRVGFSTINYTGTDTANEEFLHIADFTQAHKDVFFKKIYDIKPGDSTPLRTALSKAGRIFGGKFGAGNPLKDPLQYWCQRNYAILSTDGFWNDPNTDGIIDLNGNTIGNHDGVLDPLNKQFFEGKTATSSTLADVAAYYYNTDLRPGPVCATGAVLSDGTKANVCNNGLAEKGRDTAPHQHMTTYTIGLGVSGQLPYQANYETASSGAYYDITQKGSGWPVPKANDLTTVDDLWHAAVNGRGYYYSALNANELANGLADTLLSLQVSKGAGAAASTSNLEPVIDDNKAFTAEYRTLYWDGDIQGRSIDLGTGELSKVHLWSAKEKLAGKFQPTLDGKDTRKIFTFKAGAAGNMREFYADQFSATEKAAWFNPKLLSQYAVLSGAQQSNATPDNLINYLRGQWDYEIQDGIASAVPPIPDVPNARQVFRDRQTALGDIVSARPVYVKVPPFTYNESLNKGFADHKAKVKASRDGVVYVGANDGMLHAFDAENGDELWAYVPSFALPNMFRLADKNYDANHRYFVDGSPTAAEIYDGSQWKTILVGGLGAGGRGYYALDITNPKDPKVLWEFGANENKNLGLTFGNPIVAKISDGRWVVIIASGYNNGAAQSSGDKNDPQGDGVGRIFILNAGTGKLIHEMTTGVGDADNPSGLAKISGWVDDGLDDNVVRRVYGGDLLGNMWRFDLDDLSSSKAYLLATFKGPTGKLQPITIRPDLGKVNGHTVVFFGTGRLLGTNDITDTDPQSIYAVKDRLGDSAFINDPRSGVCSLVKQDIVSLTENTRTSSFNPVDWTTKCGWFLDLNPGNKSPGERVNVDVKLQLGVLAVATNVPSKDVCLAGGSSWLYFLDYRTGTYFANDSTKTVAIKLGEALAVGISTYRLPNGKVVTNATLANNQRPTKGNPSAGALGGGGKRVSWRELFSR